VAHEAYRTPEAALEGGGPRRPPRSAVVAVVLGTLGGIFSSIVGQAGLAVLGVSPEEMMSWTLGVPMSAATGVVAGWVAAHWRRGPWLGVTLGIATIDVLVTLLGLALDTPGNPGTPAGAAMLAASLLGDFTGGWVGREW